MYLKGENNLICSLPIMVIHFYNCFMYMGVLFTCMCTTYVPGTQEASREPQINLKL